MIRSTILALAALAACACWNGAAPAAGEDWPQLQFDARRSGNAADRQVEPSPGLVAAVPLGDAVFTAPAVAGGRVYVIDGSGTAFCFDARSLEPLWKLPTGGGPANCNNVSSPAIVGGYLHFGTMAGGYYVVDAATGKVANKIECGEPILGSPAVVGDRAYFATLGSRIYAVTPEGRPVWTWDYVKERLDFAGDRFDGRAWLEHNKGRATWRDQFCCSRDMAAFGHTLVIPAGGELVWLEDAGEGPKLRAIGQIPSFKGSELPALFGLSLGEDGAAYCQWHRRDNTGRVEILRLKDDGTFDTDFVPGTQTRNDMPGLLSFSAVSLRGQDVYRCRPQEDFGLCRHRPGQQEPDQLGAFPSIAPPVLAGEVALVGGLDGRLYGVPLAEGGRSWSYTTAFGRPISAPCAVADGRIYFGCEDGYLYVLGPGGNASPPARDLELWKIRSRLSSKLAGPQYDWFTNFGDMANSNANDQGIRPPFRIKWIRRYEGTFKHLPVCGGGRMYTHTAEGQIFAVEQETGRLLWRRYWPGVHVCFTSPIYHDEKLLVPQAGLKKCLMRCLDAATGELVWEAPFSGSPSWSRAQPPVIHGNLAIYMFGTGKYVPQGSGLYVMRHGKPEALPETTAGEVSWLYSHDNPFYPADHKALVRAWDLKTGKEVWTADFSEYGAGGDDAGLCLMDGKLYYSCFFGYAAKRRGQPGPHGITCAMDPDTGKVLWKTTDYSVTAGCAISGRDGRLYLGGYNPPSLEDDHCYVWCLDARDGGLVWKSEPLIKAINVVTVAPRFVFAFSYGGDAYVIDKASGKILRHFNMHHACTRFSFSEPYLIGTNVDVIDLSDPADPKLVSSGPCIDPRECVGGTVSSGRIFYTGQASGLQLSVLCGEEAEAATGLPAR